jgi:hypothetical protein
MVTLGDQTEWAEKGLERLRFEYDLKPDDYCIDIGSYRREWADEIIKRYGCKVECFEALDDRAAWTYDGELEIGGVFLYSSIFTNEGKRKVKCEDIAKYLNREVAVMKINIEGGEYDLLSYIIDKGLHKNIKNIQVQFHKVDGLLWEVRSTSIQRQLMKTHELTYQYPFVWENWKRNE